MLSPAYTEIKRLRTRGECEQAIAALSGAPPSSDDEAFEAAICLFVCGDAASCANVCRTWRWKASWARDASHALAEMLAGGEATRTLSLAKAAAESREAPCDASSIYLLALQANGDVAQAYEYLARRWPDPPLGEPLLLTAMAEIALAARDLRLAYRCASAVLTLDPDDYRALLAQCTASLKIGNVPEALGGAMHAERVQPGAAAAIEIIMLCRNRMGDYYGTLAAFSRLHDQESVPPAIRVELATAYMGLEQSERATAELRAALDEKPLPLPALRTLARIHTVAGETAQLQALLNGHLQEMRGDIECLFLLGLAALQRGALDETARWLAESADLARRSGEPLAKLPWPVPEPRIRHDVEQLQLLDRRNKLDDAGRQALNVLKRFCERATGPDARFALVDDEATSLKQALFTVHHVPDPPFGARALGENDFARVEDRYLADRLVVIDGFLAPGALAALREFCEEATVWKLNYERGYVGAILAQGFSPRVLLAISDELKRAMPRVIGDEPMLQAWAFKYDQRMQGINMHADFAKVNVNFWITPDAACADPSTGGMVVYDLPAPKHWTFADYNSDSEKLAAYLRVHGAKPQRVPYRANRCVLFDSSLIHITDELHFKPGYENRRVNVTMLYGKARTVG